MGMSINVQNIVRNYASFKKSQLQVFLPELLFHQTEQLVNTSMIILLLNMPHIQLQSCWFLQGMYSTIVPLILLCHAGCCYFLQASQLGRTFGCFFHRQLMWYLLVPWELVFTEHTLRSYLACFFFFVSYLKLIVFQQQRLTFHF